MKKLIPIIFLIFLTGCATRYQKLGIFCDGYQDMKLAENIYSVEYYSNSATSQGLNERHALHRAAELTIEKGYRYFIISNSRNLSSSYTVPVISNTIINTNNYTYGSYGHASTITSGGYTLVNPAVQLIIVMSHKKSDKSFDANIILSNFPNEPKEPSPTSQDRFKRILGI